MNQVVDRVVELSIKYTDSPALTAPMHACDCELWSTGIFESKIAHVPLAMRCPKLKPISLIDDGVAYAGDVAISLDPATASHQTVMREEFFLCLLRLALQ